MIPLSSKVNVLAPNGTYPYGNIKDDTGLNDGTPVDVNTYADIHQLMSRIMDLGGLAGNGLPDNATNGYELATALLTLIENQVKNTKRVFASGAGQNLNHNYISNLANLPFVNISGNFYEIDFSTYNMWEINSSTSNSKLIESFGSAASPGFVGFFKFATGGGTIQITLNSTNAGGLPIITKKGVAGANTAYTIVAETTVMVIRYNTHWELINMP